jgi:glycine cleavage system H protein
MNELKTAKMQFYSTPRLLLYTTKHTWAQITPEGNIRVGISDYAQKHLKGIARVLTKPVGEEISRMEPFGVAETWMFMFDLYAPVTGKIVKVNEKFDEEPFIVNGDPYGKGWIIEIEPESAVLHQELKELLGITEYKELISR